MKGISVGRTGGRSGVTAAVLTALSPIAIVPHIVEDAAAGTFERFGLEPESGALLVGATLALQVLFAFGSLRDHRWGYGGVLFFGVIWVVAAVADHPGAFLADPFRAGLPSRLTVWGIVLFQGGAAIAALLSLRATRQTSFRGTGSFNV